MDELTKQTIDALRVQMEANDRLYRERWTNADKAVIQAKDAVLTEMAAADGRLQDHIEAQKQSVAASVTALHERWQANERAVIVAADVSNRRLDNMNEFRGALADQQASFITNNFLWAAKSSFVMKLAC